MKIRDITESAHTAPRIGEIVHIEGGDPDTRGWREKVLSILKDRDGRGQPRRDVRKVDNHTYTFISRGGDPHELRFDPELTDRFWVTGSGRDWDSNRFDSMEDAIEALYHLLG